MSLVPQPGADPRAIVKRCRDEGIVINLRGGRLRVSPHCYNTHEEMDRLQSLLLVHYRFASGSPSVD